MATSLILQPADKRRGLRLPRYVLISAWAVPVLIVGQFALLAVVPVGLVMYGVWRHSGLPALRWSAALLTGLYASSLAIWALRPDGAQSLSKDLSPVLAGLIVAASLAVITVMHLRRKLSRAHSPESRGGFSPQPPERSAPRSRSTSPARGGSRPSAPAAHG